MARPPSSVKPLEFAVPVDVFALAFDDRNLAKLAMHGLAMRDALEVLDEDPRLMLNLSPDGAPYVLIGPTAAGRMVTLPIDPTPEPGVWRPRTGYPSSDSEALRYEELR
jgi:hypothetical protein